MFRRPSFIWKYISFLFLLFSAFFFVRKEAYHGVFYGETCSYLEAGNYYLEFDYATTTENLPYKIVGTSLVVNISGETDTQNSVLEEGILPLGSGTIQAQISLPEDMYKFTVEAIEGVGEWRIQSVKLVSYDNYLIAAMFLFLAVGSLLYGAKYYKKEHNGILLLLGVGVLASLPLFNDYLIIGHDTGFHLSRINGIYASLRAGQFPVRINPIQQDGYGYATGIMYPQLFLYFCAFLRFFHISAILSLKILIFCINIGTAIFTYFALLAMSKNRRMALLTAVVYVLVPYRLINLYIRCALGESLSMCFLPIILWGVYEILWNKRQRWWILALGMTAIVSSHVLSLETYGILILFELLVWIFSAGKDYIFARLVAMGKAAIVTIAANLYFLVPYIQFSKENFVCYDMSSILPPLDSYVIEFIMAFEPFAQWSPLRTYDSISLTLGSALLAGTVLFASLFFTQGEETGLVNMGKKYFLVGSITVVMCLWGAPWEFLQRFKWIDFLVKPIQFPWRLFSVAAFLLCITAVIGIVEWEKRNVKWSNVTAPLILLMVFLSCGYFFGQTAYQAVRTTDVMYANGISEGDDLYLYQYNYEQGINTFGYSFQTAFMRNTSGEKITWSNYCRDYLHISVDANVLGDNNNEAVVSFPLIYYPGYETKIDGQIVENFDNSSLVSCLVPVGEHHLEVSYVGFKSFVVSDIVSLCSILLLILWGLYQGWIKKEKGQKSVQGRHV